MKRKPEVRPRKCRVYFYSGPVIQLRITGLFHSTKNDINFSLSVNYRSDPYQCASVCYWSWYGFSSRVEWCACFVSWCADQCGYIESGVIPKFPLCSSGMEWFESRGQFMDGSYVSTSGDLIFFDWGNDGNIDHVGIVESVVDGTVYTVEGNSGDKVVRRDYPIGYEQIEGYGVACY